jgi:hypothetical protein
MDRVVAVGRDAVLHILSGGYCAVSAVFMLVTVLEGWIHHGSWTQQRMMGLLVCLVWPLLLIVFLLHNRMSRKITGAVRLASL